MADRLASIIGAYIHKDQVGFIPGTQGQIRRAEDIVSLLQSGRDGGSKQASMMLSLDVQETFDSVFWSYPFVLMDHWGFGPQFTGLLRALYSMPEASIRLQGLYSDHIKIAKGTR